MRLKIDQTETENLEWQDEMRPNNAEQEAIVEQNFKQCTEIGDPKYMGVCPRPGTSLMGLAYSALPGDEEEKKKLAFDRMNDGARGLNSFVI